MAEKASIIAMYEMKRMLANHEKDMEERLAKQTRKHEEELNVFKQTQMVTNNLFTHKNPVVNNYKVAEYYKSMTKACDILFDRKPEN
jgi:hypothetical protein